MDFEYPAFLVDFSDALRALKAGRKVYRPYWESGYRESPGRYLFIWQGTSETIRILMVMMPDGRLTPFSGSNLDLLSDDWEILDDAELQ